MTIMAADKCGQESVRAADVMAGALLPLAPFLPHPRQVLAPEPANIVTDKGKALLETAGPV